MKFDLEWLQECIDGAFDPDALSEALTHCGFLVETRDADGDSEIWDVEATTNRPDVMCHRGLAREAAVAVGGSLKPLLADVGTSDEKAADLASIVIRDPDLCARYVGRVVRGVRLIESPDWLKRRLERCGVRPINAVVDATNYVLLETGQPLHAFDLDRLEGRMIVVRRATAGETLETLDGETRKLTTDDLVIADENRPVALAGIMGGADSEIGEDTVDVLLESAHFDALTVRRTARRLGMHTEASHRFERGADIEMAPLAADRAARLIAELTGARVADGRIDVCPQPWQASDLSLSVTAVSRFAGVDIEAGAIERILRGLEFEPRRDDDVVFCRPPSFRVDVERVADLYEEIIRHVGYDAIPAELPILQTPPGHRHPNWERVDRARGAAVGCGLTEIITYAFIGGESDGRVDSWCLNPGAALHLDNPLAETQGTLRRSLLPGLLAAARDNLNQGESRLSLFEQGRVFAQVDGSGSRECERLGLVLAGADAGLVDGGAGFSRLKGVVDRIIDEAAFPGLVWRRGGGPWLEEAEGALLTIDDGSVVGAAGRLAAAEADHWGLKIPVFVAELDLEAAATTPDLPAFDPLPRFPAVTVDVTVEHDVDLAYAELYAAVDSLADDLVSDITLVTRYTGDTLDAGRVRTTLRLVYRHADRSLTQDEVNEAQDLLRSRLAERLNVTFA